MITAPPYRARDLRLFLWLRGRAVRSAWRQLRAAPLKFAVIVATWGVLFLMLFALSHHGIRFIYQTAGLGVFLLDRLWYLFTFVVLIMLMISQLATAFSTMIRADETTLWLSWPVSARWILWAKWLESSCYSAWAVLLLLVPLGAAYLLVLHRPMWLLGWLLLLLVPLAAIATSLSTLALLAWLRYVGRLSLRLEWMAFGFVALCAALFWLLGERSRVQEEEAWFVALQELLPRMRLAMSFWMPSAWTAKSFNAALQGRWIEAGLLAWLLSMTAVVGGRLLDRLGAPLLLPVLRHPEPFAEPRREAGRLAAWRVRWWWRGSFSACVAKDLFLLVRDPVQWTQGLVFFGLLGTYFANIDRISWVSVEPSWRIGVGSLNLACALLVLGSLTVRFVFPQMSLEGRRLWLVHVVPGGLRRLFYAKLIAYGFVGTAIIETLLWISALRLRLPVPVMWWLAVVGVVASLSLVALTLGLGARLIDLTATDPSRLVSSSSGALALVLMFIYIGAVVWCLSMSWAAFTHGRVGPLIVGGAGLSAMSALLGYGQVRLGLKRLQELDVAI